MVGKRQKKNELRGVAPQLNSDLIYEVLARLPFLKIFTCSIVCKSWYAVTKNPVFRKQISWSQSNKKHIILEPKTQKKSKLNLINFQPQKFISLPLEPMLQELKVMSSCEGILCMASVSKLDPLVIYNPLTQEKHVLPSPSRTMNSSTIFYQQVGIGYDRDHKKFKVLRAFSVRNGSRVMKKYEVLTLGEKEVGTWRRLWSPKCIGCLHCYKVSYCNGSLYFITKPRWPFRVVRFNLSDETFCHVAVCPSLSRNSENKFFGIFDDNEGSVFLAMGKENIVGFFKLDDSEVRREDVAFTNLYWRFTFALPSFNVLAQVKKDNYLVHFGTPGSYGSRLEHVEVYCPHPAERCHFERFEVPNQVTSFAFKPSVMPLPAVPSIFQEEEKGTARREVLSQ